MSVSTATASAERVTVDGNEWLMAQIGPSLPKASQQSKTPGQGKPAQPRRGRGNENGNVGGLARPLLIPEPTLLRFNVTPPDVLRDGGDHVWVELAVEAGTKVVIYRAPDYSQRHLSIATFYADGCQMTLMSSGHVKNQKIPHTRRPYQRTIKHLSL